MAQSAPPPQGVYDGLWAKTVSVQETNIWWDEEKKTAIGVMCFNDLQWAYPTKPHRPPFHAVLGLADAGILPKPHRFEQKMEMDILE